MLPNFLIIGAAKSGTTSLYHYLRAHPQIFMPATKELSFFNREGDWNLLDWYEKQFEGAKGALAVGEASPKYAMHPVYPGVPQRIAKILPRARLIYVVRNPIERMHSHYMERLFNGRREGPIEKALPADPLYIGASRYAAQIELYLEHFSREQLLVITAERLRREGEQTMARIFRFLDVDADWDASILGKEFNRTRDKTARRPFFKKADGVGAYRKLTSLVPRQIKEIARPLTTRSFKNVNAVIPDDLRRRLIDALRDDVRRLYRYLDEPFDGWGIAPEEGRETPR